MIVVRALGKTVVKYTGYKYYQVQDKEGNFLFGFHISSECSVDVFFASAKVTFKEKEDKIIVRSE